MDDADWLTFVDVAVASCHYTEKISLFDKTDLQFINRCVAYIFAVKHEFVAVIKLVLFEIVC